MNCIYVSEIFRSVGMMTSVLTPFECGSITKLYSKDRANKYFAHNMVVFFAGGTGHPYFSTDTATVLRAVEIEADGIYLAKAIDGVYDSDPKVNPSAKKYDQVSIQEVIDKKLAVVDLTASVMCMENHIPMYVFGLGETNSIVNAVNGQFNGTVVTVDQEDIVYGHWQALRANWLQFVQDVRIRMCWTNFVLIITEHRLRFRALQMSVFRSRE